MAFLLNGRALGQRIRNKLKTRIANLPSQPGLAVLLVGDNAASHTYVDIKEQACLEEGVRFEKFVFNSDVDEQTLEDKIKELNNRSDIHGILVQLPLPSQNADRIIAVIDPKKDVDGFHPENIAAFKRGEPALVSAVALGVMRLIALAIHQVGNKQSAVIISSSLFAQPLIPLLQERSITTTVISPSSSPVLPLPKGELEGVRRADIIVVAIGKPGFLTGDMIKPGAIVIDVGTTKIDGTLYGDVDRSTVEPIAGALSPVPGGVGPMTVAMLLLNVLKAFQLQHAAQASHQQKSQTS